VPRNVSCSANVGVLMNCISTPSSFAVCKAWDRKILRLQKPLPWVDLRVFAAALAAPIKPPPTAIVSVVAAVALSTLRRLKSIVRKFGRCMQPVRSHMDYSLRCDGCCIGNGAKPQWDSAAGAASGLVGDRVRDVP